MTTHLRVCISKAAATRPTPAERGKGEKPSLRLVIEGRYARDYWLHLSVSEGATLGTLDSFLRNIWCECCDHLSAFTLEGPRRRPSLLDLLTESLPDDEGELDMNRAVRKVFPPGTHFLYDYDFGTTTSLKGRTIEWLPAGFVQKPIEILARNNPPEIPCDQCGRQTATQICHECLWQDSGWLCERCAALHECGEEMLMPVVNSPRTGSCAYCGPSSEP